MVDRLIQVVWEGKGKPVVTSDRALVSLRLGELRRQR